jgi:hypothetical protein
MLKGMQILEWTPEPAPSAAESLREDRVYGVTSMAQLDEVLRARQAKASAEKATK